MHTAKTTCPGCNEQVFLDELVRGRCPLCGCALEDFEEDDEFGGLIERQDLTWLVFNYFLYKKFEQLGATPLQVMQFLTDNEGNCHMDGERWEKARFDLVVPLSFLERVRPKRCSVCRKLFFRGGQKRISGELGTMNPEILFECETCRKKNS
jgi:hypothetical protein